MIAKHMHRLWLFLVVLEALQIGTVFLEWQGLSATGSGLRPSKNTCPIQGPSLQHIELYCRTVRCAALKDTAQSGFRHGSSLTTGRYRTWL